MPVQEEEQHTRFDASCARNLKYTTSGAGGPKVAVVNSMYNTSPNTTSEPPCANQGLASSHMPALAQRLRASSITLPSSRRVRVFCLREEDTSKARDATPTSTPALYIPHYMTHRSGVFFLAAMRCLLCLWVSPKKPQALAEASRNTPTTTTSDCSACFVLVHNPSFPDPPKHICLASQFVPAVSTTHSFHG
jgi:hypothetical protein